MIQNNVRLIDSNGKVNSYGRVEIKVLDSWYTVCGASKNKDLVADMLCQAGGYRSGGILDKVQNPAKSKSKEEEDKDNTCSD